MDLWIQNLIAHAVQSLLLVAGGLVAERALRNAHPAARLAILQAVLAGVVLLPFVQAWRPVPPVAAVSAGATAITATIGAAESSARVFPLALLVLLASGVLARCAWIAGGMLRLRALRAQATAVVARHQRQGLVRPQPARDDRPSCAGRVGRRRSTPCS